MSWLLNDTEPYIDDNTTWVDVYKSSNKVKLYSVYNNDLVLYNMLDTVDNYMIPSYPSNLWHIFNNNDLILNGLLTLSNNYMIPEYPTSLYRTKNNEPNIGTESINIGAFYNATKLNSIIIDKSVKQLGEYTFTNTNIKEVYISNDTIYYSTTFPKDCVIKFY